jgi:uncharacterized membrane protein HdeD (DUF308 family)
MTEPNEIRWLSWALLFIGVATLAVGIFLVADPGETLEVIVKIIGIFLLVDGLVAVIAAIVGRVESRGLLGVVGVLSAIAGLVLIKKPDETIAVVVLIVGVWLVVAGVARFLIAFGVGQEERRGSVAVAVIDVVAGIVILAWPGPSAKTFAVILGIVFIIRGLIYIWAGWQLRRIAKAGPAGGMPATA